MKNLELKMPEPPILISNVNVMAPKPLGTQSILILHGKITALTEKIDPDFVKRLSEGMGVEALCMDGAGCTAIPGLIDPHEHLTGGSGEDGFATQTPSITLDELLQGGITTVVGCIGVDTYTQNLPHLYGKVKGLREEGISAWMYTGGYDVPPRTLTGDVRTDMILVSEVIGAGESAISDLRSTQPTSQELARLVASARTGGILTKKAGITHFHLGDESGGLAPLRDLLDHFDICADCLYPTHVERKPALLKEAAEITHRGVTVDMDTCEQNVAADIAKFEEHGGLLRHLTFSSDASIAAPRTLFEQIRECILKKTHPVEELLSLVTTNPARVLKMPEKGKIAVGADGDVVLVDSAFQIRDIIASGRLMMRNGEIRVKPRYQKWSNRFGPELKV